MSEYLKKSLDTLSTRGIWITVGAALLLLLVLLLVLPKSEAKNLLETTTPETLRRTMFYVVWDFQLGWLVITPIAIAMEILLWQFIETLSKRGKVGSSLAISLIFAILGGMITGASKNEVLGATCSFDLALEHIELGRKTYLVCDQIKLHERMHGTNPVILVSFAVLAIMAVWRTLHYRKSEHV